MTKCQKKAIIITRVSSWDIPDKEGNLEKQVLSSKKYCEQSNLQVSEILTTDSKFDKNQLSKLRKIIQSSKEVVIVVVDSIDRIQRKFNLFVALDEFVKLGKVELHFIKENLIINLKTQLSEMIRWDMSIIFAKSYLMQLSENVKRALENKKLEKEKLSTLTVNQSKEI